MNETFDLKKIRSMNESELKETASAIRSFLLEKVSQKGGHLSSNLGTVELTLALVRAFDVPNDRIIFDVGHQSYTYKAVTGRADAFDTLRDTDGLSGFPKRKESAFDAFDSGHSSNSISAAIGMAKARDLLGKNYSVVSVIGDGSLTGGEAYEGLNNASTLDSSLIIILNDNGMSISRNVGGLTKGLTALRSAAGYNKVKKGVKDRLDNVPLGDAIIRSIVNAKDSVKELMMPSGMFFENIGLKYLGPVDGHDILSMESLFRRAKKMNRPVLIHVLTEKGKGYRPAERHPSYFHGVGPFDLKTGRELNAVREVTFSDLFGAFMEKQADPHPEIVSVTAAMGSGVGLKSFKRDHPDRFFDVGIAEQHAVSFAAGLALSGIHPYVAVYSSFLQRAYDQIVEDVCLQDLPVTFCIDRAGITGRDGETHQGAFDLCYMMPIPNMTVMAPRNGSEFIKMLSFSLGFGHPLSIRYPKGKAVFEEIGSSEIEYGKAETLLTGAGCLILSVGTMADTALEAAKILQASGICPTVLNMRFVKPWDTEAVRKLIPNHALIVTLEDGAVSGGFGQSVARYVAEKDALTKVVPIGIPDLFVPQGSVNELKTALGMDASSIAERILLEMNG